MKTQEAFSELQQTIAAYPALRSVSLSGSGKITLHFYTRPRKSFESAAQMQEWMESRLWFDKFFMP